MRANIYRDVFEQAIFALSDNKLRTMLSILGIAVGIAAVMAVGSVSEGVRKYIYSELETYGIRTIWVYREQEKNPDPNRKIRQGSGISEDDYKFFRTKSCCPALKRASPMVYLAKQETIRVGSDYYTPNMEGVGIEYLDISNDQLAFGRNFRQDDMDRRRAVAIIGPTVAKDLFARTNPMGKTFRYFKKKYTIIGVLQQENRDVLSQLNVETYDYNKRILIPYTNLQTLLGSDDIHTLLGEAYSLEGTLEAMDQVKNALNRRYNGRFNYKAENMQGWIDTAEGYVAQGRNIGLSFAALALLVGGLGIMNIMSTSVIERTREIGVRKALGAQYSDILYQFLMEATAVSTIGGAIGLVLGIIATYIVGWASGYNFSPSILVGIIAIVVSAAVGMLSGYFPAKRGAKMKPVDALRYE